MIRFRVDRFPAALAALVLSFSEPAFSRDTLVSTKTAFTQAEADLGPGDTLTLADGDWTDTEIRINAIGAAGRTILLRAKTPGKAVLRGSSRLICDGKYIVMDGFSLKGNSTRTAEAITFTANSSECRLTGTAIDGYNMPGGARDIWVYIAGFRNRVEYCSFTGKKNQGITVRVKREGEKSDEHAIAHNYFGPRPAINGNGAEEIQIGLMETQFSDSKSIVEYNLFEECNGELENVSVKSGGNIIRYNTFLRCESHITLRHGSGSVVAGNYIDGGGAGNTGGIRVCGKHHVIVNNFITGLRGTDEYGGGINIHGGDATDPKTDPANHVPAGNTLVAYNTIADNREGIVYGGMGATAPTGAVISDNIIMSGTGTLFSMRASTPFAKAEANILFGTGTGIGKLDGFATVDPALKKSDLNGYVHYLPDIASPARGKASGDYRIPEWPGLLPPPDIGENLYGAGKLQPLSRNQVGPAWNGGPVVSVIGKSSGSRYPASYPGGAHRMAQGRVGIFDAAGRKDSRTAGPRAQALGMKSRYFRASYL